MRITFICLLLLLNGFVALGQNIVLKGVVRDKSTKEPVPFSSIQFKGTTIGTSSNDEGSYVLSLHQFPSDTLLARAIGYNTLYLPIDKKKKKQTLNLELIRKDYKMNELVVHAGINPALNLLKKVIKHKPDNNPDNIASYSQKVYNKLEFDLDRLNKEKIKNSKLLKPFTFLLENIDTTTGDQPFLPIFLTETISDNYYQKDPRKEKEIITASHRSGIKNNSFTQFLGNRFEQFNVYENFITVFGKDFPSPINDKATLFYHYQIVDTQYIDRHRCYQVAFQPKHEEGQYFFGDFWVDAISYAIQQMNLQVTKEANINFVHQINLVQEFKPLGDTLWFPTKDKIIAQFIPMGEKRPGVIGRKTTHYYDIKLKDPRVKQVFKMKKFRGKDVYVRDSAMGKPMSFWHSHRYVGLNNNEKKIYSMMDTLETMPLYHTYVNVIKFITTGTKAFGPIEFGPYYYLISTNALEKVRLRFDMGTTPDLFKDIYLHAYLAYGFEDHHYKGSVSGLWILKRNPRIYLFGSYSHDFLNSGGSNAKGLQLGGDNIFTLAIRKKGIPQKFVMADRKKFEFYKEWDIGFSVQGDFENTIFEPYRPLPMENDFKGHHEFNNLEISLTGRFAWREKYLKGQYYRVGLGSKYPIVSIKGAMGIKDLLHSRYRYKKLNVNVNDKIGVPPLGKIHYSIYGGKIWGTLPYLLLKIHPGNELYFYNIHAFNMMNRYEFLSDEWLGFNIEHDIGGGLFNYIPLLKKLKLRQFWTAKYVIGRLSDKNRTLNLKKGYSFQTLEGSPYMEIGTGIENILHFIRVDFVWRVLPKSGNEVLLDRRFGIFGSFRLTF